MCNACLAEKIENRKRDHKNLFFIISCSNCYLVGRNAVLRMKVSNQFPIEFFAFSFIICSWVIKEIFV